MQPAPQTRTSLNSRQLRELYRAPYRGVRPPNRDPVETDAGSLSWIVAAPLLVLLLAGGIILWSAGSRDQHVAFNDRLAAHVETPR